MTLIRAFDVTCIWAPVPDSCTRVLRFLLLFVTLGRVAGAQAFSADVVTRAPGDANLRRGRVYVSGNVVRIETPEIPGGFFLIDSEHAFAWFVRPAQRVFMDARLSSRLTRLLVVVDPGNPCGQWKSMETNASPFPVHSDVWTCDRVSDDALDGRAPLKYHVRSLQTFESDRWVDASLRFPTRIEIADGATVVLEHIVRALQPSDLFAIPPDFHKFDPADLLNQIRQSDVWVEPPKQ